MVCLRGWDQVRKLDKDLKPKLDQERKHNNKESIVQ